MEVDKKGHIFAAAGGKGVIILDEGGRHLGTVHTGTPATGVAFGGDGYMYVTGTGSVCRFPVETGPPR